MTDLDKILALIGTVPSSKLYWEIKSAGLSDALDTLSDLGADSTFQQKIYHVKNDIKCIPKCHVCHSSLAKFVRIDVKDENGERVGRKYGYGACSSACSQKRNKFNPSAGILAKRSRLESLRFSLQDTTIYDAVMIDIPDCTPKQMEWHIDNGTASPPLCTCGNPMMWKNGKYISCSRSCAAKKSAITRGAWSENKKSEMLRLSLASRPIIPSVMDNRTKEEKIRDAAVDRLISSMPEEYTVIDVCDDKSVFTIERSICGHQFEIDRQLIKSRKYGDHNMCTICNPRFAGTSSSELELYEFIKSVYHGEIVRNTRSIIYPLELDIYLPALNLAFEFNGLYWHTEDKVGKMAHRLKSERCRSEGIRLVHVWEHLWNDKRNIYQSLIRSMIGAIDNKLYARKCEIAIINDTITLRSFFDDNHLQGAIGSTIAYGLMLGDELVQVMSFTHWKSKNRWEIARLCTKINHLVIGGTQRLFARFMKDYGNPSVFTYSDASVFTGHVYGRLGMNYYGVTDPDYFYVNCDNNTILSRQQCQKHKLIAAGFDESMTEREIMESRGYKRVYGCGHWKFELTQQPPI